MKHPLYPHFVLQLASLEAAEAGFSRRVGELELLIPSLQSYLGGLESDSRQRCDCLQSLLTSTVAPAEPLALFDGGIEEVIHARGNTERRALALAACARMHHHLVNGYRVARALAHRLGYAKQTARIDVLLTRMSDSFPCCGTFEAIPGNRLAIAG